ncbi:MAG: hypothetical protein MPJ25_00995 [Pirellulales bacterium]|nr:hypothetical protein [Pirellulales bacterium]
MKTNVVYLHVKKGTDYVFYVGIGNSRRRAYSTKGRNDIWLDIVSECNGFDVRIINEGLSLDDANYIEKELVDTFGKIYNGTGQLANIANGGGGVYGCPANSTSYKKGMVSTFKGKKHSKESREKISRNNLGKIPWNKGMKFDYKPNPKLSEALKGRKRTEETKEKIRLSKTGKSNPNSVSCTIFGKTYNSFSAAAKDLKVSPTTISEICKSSKFKDCLI